MPKKRKNRGKQRTQKKSINAKTIDTTINVGTNEYESESIEYINENEKLKNVIARLETKLQESVVKTETNTTDLSKCANRMNESSSVAKSSSSTVVQNTKIKNESEEFQTAASSSCTVNGNLVFPDLSSSSSDNKYVKNYYKCNFCEFKLERIFENRKKLLEHLRTHKFPSIERELQKKQKENDEIKFESSNIDMVNSKKINLNVNDVFAAEPITYTTPNIDLISNNKICTNNTLLPNQILRYNIKKIQSPNTILSIQKQVASIPSTSKNNNNVEDSSIDAYYSSMDKRKNRSMPYIVCKICNIKFTHKSSYVRHKISKHTTKESALNPKTGEPFDVKQKICRQCNQVFSRESVLNQHISTVHYGLKPFECEYCKRKFSAKSNLFEHVRTHTRERPYNCEYCKTTFPYRSTLTTHIKNVHKNIIGAYKPPESNFRCKYCNVDFPNYSQRYRHLKQVHLIAASNELEDPLSVQNIGSIIQIENNDVEIHLVYVDQSNDLIEVCNDENELIDEIKEENEITGMLMEVEEEYIEHTENQYIDNIFEQNINQEQITENIVIKEDFYDNTSDIIEEDYLEDEIEILNEFNDFVEYVGEEVENTTTNLMNEVEADIIDVVNEIPIFKCEKNSSDLKSTKSIEKTKEFNHLINTSKDNIDAIEINKLSQDFIDKKDPKKCSKCDTSFSRVAVLHQHIKSVHLQLKPYKCGYCEKKFASRSNLIEHIRLHTGEKPYKCGACEEDFNRRGLFTKHVKIAHPDRLRELLA